jgi:hypothetical protein
MSRAADHECAILLQDALSENASVGAHYMRMVSDYACVGDVAGARYALKCAVAVVKATVGTFNDLDALSAPRRENTEVTP